MMKAQPGVSHASVIKAYTASRVHDIVSYFVNALYIYFSVLLYTFDT